MAIKGGLVCWLPKTSHYDESAYTHINPYIHLHCSLDEHTVTASAYARIIYMYELLTVLQMGDPIDV